MSRFATPLAFLVAFVVAPAAWGQVGNLGGGNNAGNNDAGANNRATDTSGGATTSGEGSATTSGDLSSEADGAEAGANRATGFIGAGAADNGFVGGGAESNFVSNRRFQGIQQEQINKSTTSQSSGSPRRVPVSFRVGFKVARNPGSSLLIRRGTRTPLQRVAASRPELRGINVAVDAKGVAMLTGVAPDPAAVRLAANMVRLRAGVRQVQSQVRVVAASTRP